MSSFFAKLKSALTKTSSKIGHGIDNMLFKQRLDQSVLNDLEELLIISDVGVHSAAEVVRKLRKQKFDKEVTSEEIKHDLAGIIENMLPGVLHDFAIEKNRLNIILFCGVNGSGKTTTIGKIANLYTQRGYKVAVAACDTFRAAAVEQLSSWADRSGAKIYKGDAAADPASVAYNAIAQSLADGTDILFIDTAGRLHNQKNLMDELAKIVKVIKKNDVTAPHHSILVLDGTTGQNMIVQVKQFIEVANVDSLIITKLDGTAKAGALVSIADSCKIPVSFIGLGEGLEDLRPFVANEFARALVGLEK